MPGYVLTRITHSARIDASADSFDFGPPPTSAAEVRDWPGEYAQRFDGIDPAPAGDVEPVVDPSGGLWLCRGEGEDRECIPW